MTRSSISVSSTNWDHDVSHDDTTVESSPSSNRSAASTPLGDRDEGDDDGNSRQVEATDLGHDLDAIELQTPNSTRAPSIRSSNTSSALPLMQSLPEPDRGKAAYRFLFVAFIVETVIWGLPSAYGVFLAYYMREGVHGNTAGSSLLPLVGTFASGLMYLFGPPTALLLNPNPQARVPAIRIGACIVVLALLLSSFAKTTWQLLLTQGFLYSVGGSLCYYSTFHFLSEWFVQRRGFANGVCFAGTAAGGLFAPLLLETLLSRFGSARTLQALSVFSGLTLGAAMPWLKPRLPVGRGAKGAADKKHETGLAASKKKNMWKSKRLWIFMIANVAQSFGFFLPTLFLPSFASSLGLSGAAGSATLACVNASSVISRVVIGILSDRMSPHLIGAITLCASSLSVLILWGVTSTSFAPLLIFSLVLGIACGGWTSLYAAVIRAAARDDPNLSTTLFGLISFTRGLGSILTAPVSSFLLAHPLDGAKASTGYGVQGGKYGSLVVFAGLSLFVAAGSELAISL